MIAPQQKHNILGDSEERQVVCMQPKCPQGRPFGVTFSIDIQLEQLSPYSTFSGKSPPSSVFTRTLQGFTPSRSPVNLNPALAKFLIIRSLTFHGCNPLLTPQVLGKVFLPLSPNHHECQVLCMGHLYQMSEGAIRMLSIHRIGCKLKTE